MWNLTLSQAVDFLKATRPGVKICEHQVADDGRILIKTREMPDGRDSRARQYYTFEKNSKNGELLVRCMDIMNNIIDLTAEFNNFKAYEEEQSRCL